MPIYQPEEDSYLMSKALEKELPKLLKQNPKLRFLEIGCGSGINLETARKEGVNAKNILGSDINSEAVDHCKKLGFKVINSDLFDKLEGKFDLIVFNPPYLPEDESEPLESRIETNGGKKGNEVVVRFLKQAKNHLSKNGKIMIITSSLAQEVDFSKLGYKSKVLSEKKLFFERLVVWECLKV